jgi:chromosome segregation ATPase
MEYLQLKDQLNKILNDDVQNRQSLQEFRRNVYLNSESTKKHELIISEKESELKKLSSSIKQFEEDAHKKSSLVDELRFQIELQKEEFEQRENGLLDLINSLKNEIESFKNVHTELSSDQEHMSKLSVQNAEYAGKIRELIYHIDAQNQQETSLNEKITELESQIKNTDEEIESLKAQLNNQVEFSFEKEKLIEELNNESSLNSELQNELSFSKHTITDLKQNIKNLEETQLQLISENNDLKESFKVEHELMQKDNADLIAELGLIQIEIETIKTENLELTNSVTRLNELSSELELKNNLVQDLKTQLTEFETSNENNKLLSDELAELKIQFINQETIVDEFNLLKEKYTDITDEFNQSIINLNLKSEDYNQLMDDYSTLNTKFMILQNEFEELNEEHVGISEIRNELFSLNELLNEKNTNIHQLELELERLQNNINSNNSGNNSTELEKVNQLTLETEILHQQLTDLDEYSKKLVNEFEFEKSNLTIIISDLKNQLTQQKSTINSSNEDAFIDKLFKQIDLLNDENALLSTENDDIKDALTDIHKKYESLSQVIENQKNEIINLEERNKQIKLATELEVSDEETTDMRLKINELVREIDKCIALLSE